eukprot:1144742-Prorocentrum_lima.AAC.1
MARLHPHLPKPRCLPRPGMLAFLGCRGLDSSPTRVTAQLRVAVHEDNNAVLWHDAAPWSLALDCC